MSIEGSVHPDMDESEQVRLQILKADEWTTLRDIRLVALKDSPDCFLSNYERELTYDESRWRAEFERGEWIIVFEATSVIGLIGAVTGFDKPASDRYLEYLWVSPTARKSGVASTLIQTVLDRLRLQGISTIWLWILDGNDPAWQLYTKKFGFVTTEERQPLEADPSRCEERMRLDLRTGIS